ncbi:Putative transposase (identified by ISEscan HMM) [Escherichia coli]|nr:Putative transposase (identified by ISEscan HMM) [Escherichia coli]
MLPQEGWLYLAGIKDVYTCEIVGYAMGERMTKELTGKALFMALRSQRPPAGLIHHSDRGSQYCIRLPGHTGAVWSENINVA